MRTTLAIVGLCAALALVVRAQNENCTVYTKYYQMYMIMQNVCESCNLHLSYKNRDPYVGRRCMEGCYDNQQFRSCVNMFKPHNSPRACAQTKLCMSTQQVAELLSWVG